MDSCTSLISRMKAVAVAGYICQLFLWFWVGRWDVVNKGGARQVGKARGVFRNDILQLQDIDLREGWILNSRAKQ